jgi:hypothetical protein
LPRPKASDRIVTTRHPKPDPTRTLREHAGLLAAAALLVAGAAVLLLLIPGGDERAPRQLPAQPATAARDFRESVGVNVHLSYGDTAYADLAAVRRALAGLGVRHVRDGACAGCADANERIAALGRDGVRFTLIAGSPRHETGTLEQNLESVAGPLRSAVEAVEGPNEYDARGGAGWAAALRDYQQELFERVRGDERLRGLDVIGPSFVDPESRDEAGDMSAWMTLGNLHSYPGGGEPAANLERERALARAVSGAKPVVATETGYHDALSAQSGQPGVDETTAAAYIPRLYLDYFRAGVPRTFAYELVDEKPDPAGRNPELHFGLLRDDWSPKPAYDALRGLLAAVGNGAPEDGRASLRYAVDGGDDTRRLLLATGDGSLRLVLWRPDPVWDQTTGTAQKLPQRDVTVRFGEPVKTAAVIRRGRTVAEHSDPTRVPVELGADPVVLAITRGGGDG